MAHILAGIRLLLVILITMLFYVYNSLHLLFVKHTDKRGFSFRRAYLKIVIPLLGYNLDKSLSFNDEPTLYVSNHRGLFDFFVILRYLDAYVVSKAEFINIPILGPLSAYTGVIFVDRANKKSRGATRQKIIDSLKEGKDILLFPEGTTNVGQTTMDFKIGAFVEVAKNGIPVVPIALEYKTRRDYYNNISTMKMFVRGFGKCFTHSKLRFGPTFKNQDPEILLQETKQWIDNAMLDMQKDWSTIKFE